MKTKVVITGMGAVSAAGVGVAALWDAARNGVSGVKPMSFPRGRALRTSSAAHLFEADLTAGMDPRTSALMDRFSIMGLIAADQACAQAGLKRGEAGERCAVIIGSGIGGLNTVEEGCYKFYATTETRYDPMAVPKIMPSAAAAHIGMRYGATGPSFCISSACTSSAQSIGIALLMIRSGIIDRAIVGGSEAILNPACIKSWELLRVLTNTECRPFSTGRNGMVLGEGAGVFVIETEQSAESRGANAIVELAGYGTTTDAKDLLQPDAASQQRAMNAAIADADLKAFDIGHVNAHGTGTILNDQSEAHALEAVFGERIHDVAISATKPIHGHALGASGAIELIIAVQSLLDQVAPPTINWLGPDPQFTVQPVVSAARPIQTRAALSNSFAFGGINASLVVRSAA
jgi:nodulation protein E